MNSDVIQLLPDSVANQIAAGEVIQCPASVIKELVENSVDAGARNIQIVLKDAGKTLIQIIDDGCGMSPKDARMAFERHATSKIRRADDLFSLHTMGFRGEALPSVAAVSEVELRTMRPGDTIGTRLVIKASNVESQQPDVCAQGTNIMVKHLFYNFVARRRYLRKDSVELSHIMHEFERLALVNTDVAFSVTHNGTVLHKMLKAPLLSRIGALFGRTVERSMIPVETQATLVKISGYIGQPSSARTRKPLQYFFVNGRNMRHPMFRKAVLNCYADLIAGDAQPNFFINFEVDPSKIDVNVHPQKHEIKFEDEQMIWQVLTAAIKESLGKYNVGPAIDFDAGNVPDIPPMAQGTRSEAPAAPDEPLDPTYNPFELNPFPTSSSQESLFRPTRTPREMYTERASALNDGNWEKLYTRFQTARFPLPMSEGTDVVPSDTADAVLPGIVGDSFEPGSTQPLIQVKNRWIAAAAKTGLMLVDQHRAHVRVLYERLLPTLSGGALASQSLVFPETVEVDAATTATMLATTSMLEDMGFRIAGLEGNKWEVTGIPVELGRTEPRQALLSIVADLADSGDDPVERQRQRMALAMARTMAIRNNQPLGDDEMQRLIADLFHLSTPNYTPDGQLIVHILPADSIAALFRR